MTKKPANSNNNNNNNNNNNMNAKGCRGSAVVFVSFRLCFTPDLFRGENQFQLLALWRKKIQFQPKYLKTLKTQKFKSDLRIKS